MGASVFPTPHAFPRILCCRYLRPPPPSPSRPVLPHCDFFRFLHVPLFAAPLPSYTHNERHTSWMPTSYLAGSLSPVGWSGMLPLTTDVLPGYDARVWRVSNVTATSKAPCSRTVGFIESRQVHFSLFLMVSFHYGIIRSQTIPACPRVYSMSSRVQRAVESDVCGSSATFKSRAKFYRSMAVFTSGPFAGRHWLPCLLCMFTCAVSTDPQVLGV